MSASKPEASSSSPSPSPAARAVDFLHLTQALKTTPRTGWVNHGVDKPESIADHMYRMSLMAMVAAKEMPHLDQNKCVKLALIHDLAEAIVGDITPHDPVSKEEKAKMESDAMAKIRSTLGDALGGEEVEALWHEYEDGQTDEAKLLKVREREHTAADREIESNRIESPRVEFVFATCRRTKALPSCRQFYGTPGVLPASINFFPSLLRYS